MRKIFSSQSGFTVIEVLLAAALFVIFSTGIVSVVLQGFGANRLGSEETIANQYASEGIEAVRSIKNQAFTNLVNSAGTGVILNGSVWSFGGTYNTFGKYTRVITVTDVQRDVSGNIVTSGGSVDPNTKKITSTVSWNVTPTRNDSVVLNSYMTSWRSGRGGMLVFGDGGTTADTISYRTLDQNAQTWSGSSGTNTVTLDTANVSSQLVTTSSANISWTHTVGAQNNKLLVVQVSPNAPANNVVGVITYHGIAMTKLNALGCSSSCRDEVWYLLNPPQGTFPISVKQTNAAGISGTAETFYNVNQSTPFDNGGTTTTMSVAGTTFSMSVPSSTTDLVADWYTNQAIACNTLTLSSGQTKQVGTCNTIAQDSEASTKTGAAGATTTMSWSWTTSQSAVDIGIGIKPSTSNSFGTAADVDAGTANKALRAVRVYASSTRNEKVIVSRHYNGSGSRFLYAQVYNGSTWGNVNLLAPAIASNSALDIQDFDGTYLANGDFMVVYSDNTTTPKFKTWNGTAWSVASGTIGTSMQALTGVPVSVVASARPGSNEVMTAFFNNARAVQTEYYNGSGYITGNWTLQAAHTAIGNAPLTTKKFADFAWSPNSPTTGILAYADSAADTSMTLRLCTASGGTCTWGTAVNSTIAQANTMGALTIKPRSTANEFQACDKDAAATPTIVCYKGTFSGTTPTVSTAPVIIAAATDTGIQRSFDSGWEGISGDPMLAIYSDNTTIPKWKQYTAGTSTWSTASNLTTVTSTVKSVRVIPSPLTDDIMILLADGSAPPNLYSQVWDGTNNLMYTTPAGYTFTTHGINGSATTDLWYDFAWDQF